MQMKFWCILRYTKITLRNLFHLRLQIKLWDFEDACEDLVRIFQVLVNFGSMFQIFGCVEAFSEGAKVQIQAPSTLGVACLMFSRERDFVPRYNL